MIKILLKWFCTKSKLKTTYRNLLVQAKLVPSQTCQKFCVPGSKPICFISIFLAVNLLSVFVQTSALALDTSEKFLWVVSIITTQLLANFFLLRTVFTEPGIIPKNIEKILPEITLLQNSEIISCQLSTCENPKSYTVPSQNGLNEPLKFCETCQIFRPPRAVHCKFCDNCVLELDHHCKFLGCCIGKRNQKFFMYWLCWECSHSFLGF